MNDKYDDMIHLSRPQYDDLHPMSMSDRAAQFSPFAALTGYDDEVAETARLTDCREELDDDETGELNANMNRLLDMLDEQPEIRVTYFIPDPTKEGGRYADKYGTVRIFDDYNNLLVFSDGEKISVRDIYDIEFICDDR